MSGLGLLQAPSLTFFPFEASRMHCAAKASMNARNGRFTLQPKSTKRTSVRAELRIDDLKTGEGQCVCPELTIPEIPYIDEVVKKLSLNRDAFRKTQSDHLYLEDSYERCRLFCAEREKFLMSALRYSKIEQQRPLWAIYAWARRIDDLVDSTDDDSIRSEYLDQWEARTKDIFKGRPHDILDAALVDTISKFHIDFKLFEDGMKGMRMDITKNRYANFEELFLYCYYVAGTFGQMFIQIVGIAPESKMSSKTIYDGVVYSAIAAQLTNILKDVSDDAQLGRVYFPQDELAEFGLCDEDIFSKRVTSGWRKFIKKQIQRVRFYCNQGEEAVSQLDKSCRSKTLAGLMMYRNILDEIEENEYDNLTNRVAEMTF